ncbi:uncharacterized protein LOC129942965 isoform X3 [Eupeodes corollae]|uniref:uncharacterized protein LOC129942965 isoform X3 n=1 Tax=Eupeodes corollae TaxID=290404 RepID=UPI0024912159|nr:uncharacterized protein LOC129942965 isoform X3 [Eupeodes corollae]
MEYFSQCFVEDPEDLHPKTENSQLEPTYSSPCDNDESPKSVFDITVDEYEDNESDETNAPGLEIVQEVVDTEMYNLLSSWGFVDLYTHFISLKLNVDILKYISNEDLKEVFADKSFGIRVEFKHKLLMWRKENEIETDFDPSIEIFNSIKMLVEEEVKKRLAATSCSDLHSESSAESMPPSPSSNASISNPSSPSICFGHFVN